MMSSSLAASPKTFCECSLRLSRPWLISISPMFLVTIATTKDSAHLRRPWLMVRAKSSSMFADCPAFSSPICLRISPHASPYQSAYENDWVDEQMCRREEKEHQDMASCPPTLPSLLDLPMSAKS